MAKKLVWSKHAEFRKYERRVSGLKHQDIIECSQTLPRIYKGKVKIKGYTLILRKTNTKTLVVTIWKDKENCSL